MMNFDELMKLPCLWDVLADERRPILLYGTGNGADKIIDETARRSIEVAGVFASDGFVRDRDFRSMRVTSYSDAISRFGEDVVILVAFGSPRDEVLDFVDSLAARHTVFVPDVPLFADDVAGELFTPEYAAAHRDEIERAAALFADDVSRELFFEILAYRITGDMKYLCRTEHFAHSVAALLPGDVRRAVDCGAFTGDTARLFLSAFPDLEEIVCVEPDERSFRKLADFAATDRRVTAVNASVGETAGIDVFNASASRASSTAAQNRRAKRVEVRRVTLDMLTDGKLGTSNDGRLFAKPDGNEIPRVLSDKGKLFAKPDGNDISRGLSDKSKLFIKLDVEGAEAAALRGGRRTLAGLRPALAVAAYHRTADIFTLPALVAEATPGCRLFLRRARCLPGWELTLFAL